MLPERALPGQFKLLLPSPMPPSPASLFTTLQQNQHKQNGYPCFCCPRWQTRIPFQTTLQSWLEHLILCEPASGLGSTCRAAAHAASTGNSCKIWRLIPIILQSPQPAEKHSMVATCLRIYKLAWGPTGSTEEPHKPFTWLMQSHAHTRAVPSLVSQQHVAPQYSGCKEASSCYCSVNIAEKGWTTHTTDTQALSHTPDTGVRAHQSLAMTAKSVAAAICVCLDSPMNIWVQGPRPQQWEDIQGHSCSMGT